jgi:outer membrane protein insertion porin family
VRYFSLLAFLLVLTPRVGEAQTEASRIYVRYIEFQGVTRINDDVLRRELLQLEGGFLNTVALEQSRLRLEQLAYIERAQVSLEPVEDARDQVDVVITITEAPARRYGGGGAYSESLRGSLNGYFTNENIFGTGQRFSARVDVSDFREFVELSHTDPYARSNRVSRTVTVSSRQSDRLTADTTDLEADLATVRLQYGYRIGEYQSISLGLALHGVDLTTGALVSDQLFDWVRNNGNPVVQGTVASTDFWVAEFLMRWRRDTRNRQIFPDRGAEQSLTFRAAVPGSEAEYYAIDYELTKFWPLDGRWTVRFGAKLGFGGAYGSKTSSLPPYLNWFAGGPRSVRGYRENRLGPRDSLANPYGGNLFVSGQFELMMPLPEKWRERLRIGFFYDFGNVFSTENVRFLDDGGQSLDYDFDLSRLRQSAGIAAQFLVPIGVLRLSYGVPLNADDDHPNRFRRDVIERYQITVGVDF